jgi:hypothetical protein
VTLDRNDEIIYPTPDHTGRSAVTNDNGEFEMKPLPPGKYLIQPGNYRIDASLDQKENKRVEIPGAFIGTRVTLKSGVEPELVEVKAVPHVSIEAQHLNSKGKPIAGYAPEIRGEIDGVYWSNRSRYKPNLVASGQCIALAPHGLDRTIVHLLGTENEVLKWRKGKDGPLNYNDRLEFGLLNDDSRGIEVIHYSAPVLIVKVVTKDGKPAVNPLATTIYTNGNVQVPMMKDQAGRSTQVQFRRQDDGRFRSYWQLFPDEEMTVTAYAEGYGEKSLKLSLAEGETKELEIVLEKATPAKDGEKTGQ